MKYKSYFLYLLLCPISNDIRYVGITYQELENRLNEHIKEKGKKYKNNWIKSLKVKNQKPQIKMLMENLDENQVRSFEIWWGGFLWILGVDLTNDLSALGSVPPNWKGKKRSREDIKNIKKRMKKTYENWSVDTKRKLLRNRWTDKKRKELSERNKKPISQFDLGGNWIKDWKSAQDVIKEFDKQGIKIIPSGISNVVHNRRKTYAGFIWRLKK